MYLGNSIALEKFLKKYHAEFSLLYTIPRPVLPQQTIVPKPAFILPSKRVEPYEEVEIRIQAAIAFIQNGENAYPNIVKIAPNFEVPDSRPQAGSQGRQSRQECPDTNYRLSDDQERAVCQYLDRIESIGTSARLQIVTS